MLIDEKNLNDLYKLKYKELYTFICKKCGKIIVKPYIPNRIENCKRLLCKNCECSETKLNKSQEEKINIRKKTQLAWHNKSKYEKDSIRKRQSEICKIDL